MKKRLCKSGFSARSARPAGGRPVCGNCDRFDAGLGACGGSGDDAAPDAASGYYAVMIRRGRP